MISTKNISKIIEDVYPEALIDKIDVDDIKKILSKFTIDNCKVVL